MNHGISMYFPAVLMADGYDIHHFQRRPVGWLAENYHGGAENGPQTGTPHENQPLDGVPKSFCK